MPALAAIEHWGRLYAADTLGEHFFLLDSPFLYESLDAGKTWSNLTKTLPHGANVKSFADPRRYTHLIVGTWRGVYQEQ